MKPFGWAFMQVIDSLDGVINPRPIVVECHKQNKSGILHFVLGDRKSACGQANYLSSFIGGQDTRSTIIKDITDESDEFVKYALICPECKRYEDEMD